MKTKIVTFFSLVFAAFMAVTNMSYAQSVNSSDSLNDKQKSIVAIAALTAKGDLAPLKVAFNEGLDAGLTINEVKEELIHLYAYTGFPRSLNGILTLMEVVEARKARGISDPEGISANIISTNKSKYDIGRENLAKLSGIPPSSVQTGYAAFVPTIEVFLKEHLFADIFERGVFDYQTRELITISALAALGNVNAQMRSHMNIGLYNKLTESQLRELIGVIEISVGKKEADNATEVLNSIVAKG